jgi:N-hydroxyarylamine O-acetyltransferase
MLARVRLGAPPGTVRPRTHLVLRVRDGAASWLADVGFGAGTLMEPIPFRPGGTYEQSGWRFRVIQDDSELVLQTARAGDWLDLYGFAPEPVPLIDVETSNWFTTAHPSSTFVTGLIVCATASDGRRTALSDWSGTLKLTEQAPDGESVTEVDRARVPELLADRFGLPGWALDAADRLVATSRGHRPQAVAGEAQ